MRLTAMLALLAVALATATPDVHTDSINLVIGDLSVVAGYTPALAGLPPDDAHAARVRGHLRFAHDVLATTDTSSWPAELRAARARNLDRLQRYAEAGQFPRNDDHPDARRPTFVDDRGAICAVGALFAADRGRAAAERIARTHKYSFISQIDDAELVAWQRGSGLAPYELALIQPTYDPPNPANRNWTPFALLDRMQFSRARAAATIEVGSADAYDTMGLTLHAQGNLNCGCEFGYYATLPLAIALERDATSSIAAAGGPLAPPSRRTGLGTAELGGFFGDDGDSTTVLLRLGALLPTAPADPGRRFASARVGDAVLELPRSAGARGSFSWLLPWGERGPHGVRLRFDVGADWGVVFGGEQRGRGMFMFPRAGFGVLFPRDAANVSLETALAVARPDGDEAADAELRWSTGITLRASDRGYPARRFQTALTLAAVRTSDGWGGTLALDLAASQRPRYPARNFYD